MSQRRAGHPPRFGRTELPDEQRRALRDATRLEWGTLAFLAVTTTLVFLVLGSSQAMRTAWIEDLLSFLPPIAFLIATRVIRRPRPRSTRTGYTAPRRSPTSSPPCPSWSPADTCSSTPPSPS